MSVKKIITDAEHDAVVTQTKKLMVDLGIDTVSHPAACDKEVRSRIAAALIGCIPDSRGKI